MARKQRIKSGTLPFHRVPEGETFSFHNKNLVKLDPLHAIEICYGIATPIIDMDPDARVRPPRK
jgi:hypothetical protein